VKAMNEIVDVIPDLEIARQLLPIWTNWGVMDESVSIHSLGISYLTHLGQYLGYVSISEFPVARQGDYANIGDDVRPDSIWLDHTTQNPFLIAEFERYSGIDDQAKLESKVANLLLAHHRLGETAKFLVLAYWTQGLASLPDHARFYQVLQQGFETSTRQKVKGTNRANLLLFQFLHQKQSDQRYCLVKILQRGRQ
jgi:hypothetical protein